VCTASADYKYARVIARHQLIRLEYIKHPVNLESIWNLKYVWTRPFPADFTIIFQNDDLMHPVLLAMQVAVLQA
jgi:hypothetical protein